MTTTISSDTPLRVVWGLVADRYDVAARTPSLTAEEALTLSRIPDMGDPAAPLDDAMAYLVSDTWGTVCARYYTDSRRDSAGRLILVYDVVRPSDEQFRQTRCNPFLVFPALPENHSLAAEGELAAPATRAVIDEGARLEELRTSESDDALVDLLAAILGEGPVLFVSRDRLAQRLEAIVLALPPALRARFTFQTHALNPSQHQPRLTVSPQHISAPRTGKWTCVLPRDAATVSATARSAASALLALARNRTRFDRATLALGDLEEAETLLAGTLRLLRADQFLASTDRGDADACLRVIAESTHAGERELLVSRLAKSVTAESIAEGAASLIERDPDIGWRAMRHLMAGEDFGAAGELAKRLGRLEPLDDTDDARVVRTRLAVHAMNGGLTDAALMLAPSGTLFTDERDGIEQAVAIIGALERMAPGIVARRARNRASALGLTAVRSALAAGHGSERAGVERIRRTLLSFWKHFPPESPAERDLRVLIDGGLHESDASAQSALQLIASGTPATEIIGWANLLLSANNTRSAVQLLEMSKTAPQALGTFVRGLPEFESVTELTPEWIRLLKLADKPTATDIANRVLERSIEGISNGGRVGAVTDTCLALAALGVTLDRSRAPQVGNALKRMSETIDHESAALKVRLCYSALENVADPEFIGEIDARLWDGTKSDAMFAGWLRLVASSYARVERVRPISTFAALSQRAAATSAWKSELPTRMAEMLTRFLRLGRAKVFR